MSTADGSTKNPRARRLRRRTTVFPTVVAATSVRMVALGGPLIVVASSPVDLLVVTLHLASVAEAVEQQGDPMGYRCPSGLGMNRGLPILLMRCQGEVRGGSALPGGGTLGLLHRGGLEEIPELAVNPSPFRGRGLGHRAN